MVQWYGGGVSHALTVWGTHFNDKGYADILYKTNSATTLKTAYGKPTGLMADEISYTVDNFVVMKSSTGDYSIRVYWISYYSTGEKAWQEYSNGK